MGGETPKEDTDIRNGVGETGSETGLVSKAAMPSTWGGGEVRRYNFKGTPLIQKTNQNQYLLDLCKFYSHLNDLHIKPSTGCQ